MTSTRDVGQGVNLRSILVAAEQRVGWMDGYGNGGGDRCWESRYDNGKEGNGSWVVVSGWVGQHSEGLAFGSQLGQ